MYPAIIQSAGLKRHVPDGGSQHHLGPGPAVSAQVQTPVALVDKNVDRRSSKMRGPTRAAAEAFLQYLFQPEAQAEFAENGFRCTCSGL